MADKTDNNWISLSDIMTGLRWSNAFGQYFIQI